jgi:uncharacterized protein YqgQ
MRTCPTLYSVKELRNVFGLAGYFRKLTRDFDIISKPLTNLLKKTIFNGMKWIKQHLSNLKWPYVRL